jgi:hypothetical protein
VVEWTHDTANDERQSSLYCTFAGSDRHGDFARIEYKEGDIAASLLKIGPEIREMSDSEIVELHNQTLRDKARRASEYKQVAVEMPLGSAQIE